MGCLSFFLKTASPLCVKTGVKLLRIFSCRRSFVTCSSDKWWGRCEVIKRVILSFCIWTQATLFFSFSEKSQRYLLSMILNPNTCTCIWCTFHRYKFLLETFVQPPMHALSYIWILWKKLFYTFVLCKLRLNSLCCIGTYCRFWHSKMHIGHCSSHICTQIDYIRAVKLHVSNRISS